MLPAAPSSFAVDVGLRAQLAQSGSAATFGDTSVSTGTIFRVEAQPVGPPAPIHPTLADSLPTPPQSSIPVPPQDSYPCKQLGSSSKMSGAAMPKQCPRAPSESVTPPRGRPHAPAGFQLSSLGVSSPRIHFLPAPPTPPAPHALPMLSSVPHMPARTTGGSTVNRSTWLTKAARKHMSQARVVQLPTQAEAGRLKRKVAFLHMGFLLAVFTPPLMLCLNVVSNNDFRYFVGSGPLVSLFVLAFVLIVPVVDLRLKPASWWFLASVWAPAALFVLVGFFARNEVHAVMASLDNQDCGSFAEKRDLQRAHNAAISLYSTCSPDPGFSRIEMCPGYDDLWRDWNRELSYLKATERMLPCGGFCSESFRLWYSPGSPAPACSLYVAQWLYGAYIQCIVVMWYGVLVILVAYVVSELMAPFLQDYWEPAVRSFLEL